MQLNNQYNRCEVGKLEIFNLEILSGSNISNSLDMNAYTIVGIKFPEDMDSSIIFLQDSFDGIIFEDTYNVDNDLIKWNFTAGRHYKLLPSDTASWINLRLKTDSNESENRIIKIICRGV